MRYVFTKDFPPTCYRKGDESRLVGDMTVALYLSLGILKEVEENVSHTCQSNKK